MLAKLGYRFDGNILDDIDVQIYSFIQNELGALEKQDMNKKSPRKGR